MSFNHPWYFIFYYLLLNIQIIVSWNDLIYFICKFLIIKGIIIKSKMILCAKLIIKWMNQFNITFYKIYYTYTTIKSGLYLYFLFHYWSCFLFISFTYIFVPVYLSELSQIATATICQPSLYIHTLIVWPFFSSLYLIFSLFNPSFLRI